MFSLGEIKPVESLNWVGIWPLLRRERFTALSGHCLWVTTAGGCQSGGKSETPEVEFLELGRAAGVFQGTPRPCMRTGLHTHRAGRNGRKR